MKLISMTDFVENLRKEMTIKSPLSFNETKKYFDKVFNYSEFLKQPLTLGMFVPCDKNGNPLDRPDDQIGGVETYTAVYKEAESKVIFKGFSKDSHAVISPYGGYMATDSIKRVTVEFLVDSGVELTDNAIKELGL